MAPMLHPQQALAMEPLLSSLAESPRHKIYHRVRGGHDGRRTNRMYGNQDNSRAVFYGAYWLTL